MQDSIFSNKGAQILANFSSSDKDLEVFIVVELSEQRPGARDGSRHQMGEAESHPAREGAGDRGQYHKGEILWAK